MENLEGIIERITFYNQENSYTVAKLKDKKGQLRTIVGNLPPLYIGESLLVTGQLVLHKDYGEQFLVETWESQMPGTLLGMERFLGSGLIKGVGPATAEKIVKKYGLAALEVIAQTPDKLVTIPGINLEKAERIGHSLQEHQEIQRIMVFLQGFGISPAYALKIFQRYKSEAVRVVKENPYRLADDLFGVGFKIADQIARKVGVALDSPYRLRAGIRYWLNESSGEGHVFAFQEDFVEKASSELGVSREKILVEIAELIQSHDLFCDVKDQQEILYLAPFYYSEIGVTARLQELLLTDLNELKLDLSLLLERFAVANQLVLAQKQEEAVLKALEKGVLVITGGPGTGKTTIIKAILHLFQEAGLRVMLAAPTGRAAKRLAESTGVTAKTIHRLLGYGGHSRNGNGGFQHNEKEPLATEVLVVDEFSMVDLLLFYNLLKAITPGTRLIMVGDVEQLPSVGPGTVLRDLIQSGQVPTVRLEAIFRQNEESIIVANAHKINRGDFPDLSNGSKDFFFMEDTDPQNIVKVLPELVLQRIPQHLNCDPIEDIQVLTPMRRTITGVESLNLSLQEVLNPLQSGGAELKARNTVFRLGDKVMQIRNDYQKEVFNGDIGRIGQIDPEERFLVVVYAEVEGEREVTYKTEELDQLVLAYAISVHKSQGNEYPVVVMPVTTQHYLMLQRNLLYTAVTRAKQMVVLIGTKKAIAIAVKNNRIQERNSLLKERLLEVFQ